jgi:BirA family biotin operon repressor/biotin-[acetyl-CoA-carboxylase] ligase
MNKESFAGLVSLFSRNLKNELVNEIVAFEKIDSTNFKAKELAEKGYCEGTVVLSLEQTQGRGRFDRNWESPLGGLYFSIILRPNIKPKQATILPLLGALTVCKTITESTDLDVKIKWPNDVLINSKKSTGILLESDFKDDSINYVILGIGINLNIEISQLSKDLKASSTSISNEIGIKLDYFDFFRKILSNLEKYYKLFWDGKTDLILKEWKKNSDTIGKKVTIDTSSEKITGVAKDIDESGFLIVKTDEGKLKKITSGDCLYFHY